MNKEKKKEGKKIRLRKRKEKIIKRKKLKIREKGKCNSRRG